MQLATARLDGRTTAVGVDQERGLVELARLREPLPPSVLGVLGSVSPEEFSARIAAEPDGSFRPVDDTAFLAPYLAPGKIWGIGLNYTEHADDLAAGYPDEPGSFMKGDHTIIGPGETIDQPRRASA